MGPKKKKNKYYNVNKKKHKTHFYENTFYFVKDMYSSITPTYLISP